ncbi:MAG TPA: Maf family protein [Steroidobacteraceae bacterium]|jgi:nucleoside triphosphate pyrophosphatase|nr:Maf family protein [Steroidobacteraceae bacterium]
MPKPLIFLASASPRRSELLRQIGIDHEVRAVEVDETRRSRESATAYVARLAETKARALWDELPEVERRPVLGADTTVTLDGEIFGKPHGASSARAMLGRLSGRTHEVHTAVALVCTHGVELRLCSSTVRFRRLTDAELDWYCTSNESVDKAGGYAIQGRAAVFVSHLAGSYSGVMGLPLCETWELLAPILAARDAPAP